MKKLLFLLFLIPFISHGQLQLPFGIKVLNPQPLDYYFYNSSNIPYVSTTQANTQIPASVRYIGQTVLIGTVEYCYKTGIADGDLVIKNVGGGGSSTFVSLTDGPGSFVGRALNFIRVNNGESALEYLTPTQTLNSILPTQTGQSGKYITTNGTSVSWQNIAAGITSLTATSPLTGGTITTSGTIGLPASTDSQDGYLTLDDHLKFNNKQSQIVNIFPGSYINWYGDSFTNSYLAPSGGGFYEIVNNQLAVGGNNYAVSGHGALSAVTAGYTNITTTNIRPSIFTFGYNDCRSAVNSTKHQEKIKSCERALIAASWLATAIPASNGSISTTGTWTTSSVTVSGNNLDKATLSLSGQSRFSTVNGSTLSFGFTGTTLVIGTFSTDEVTTFGGDFTYAIDGGTPVTYTGKNKADGVSDGTTDNSIVPNAIVLTNLGSGSHAVVITTTSTATVRIDYFGTLINPQSAAPIIVNSVPKMNAAGYAANPTLLNDAYIIATTASLNSVADEFKAINYPIIKNDVNLFYNVLTDINADNIHPNALGYSHIASSILSVINSGLNVATSAPSNPIALDNLTGNKSYFYNGTDATTISTNRNPVTGAFDNTGKAASIYSMGASAGDGGHFWFATASNNTVPPLRMALDKNGTLNVGSSTGFVFNSPAYIYNGTGTAIFGINKDPVSGVFANTGAADAYYKITSTSGVGSHKWYGSNINNTPAINTMTLDESGNLTTLGNANALGILNAANTTQSQFRIGLGGSMTSLAGSQNFIMGGGYFNGSNWKALSTDAAGFSSYLGLLSWYIDNGLTIGNSFSPTEVGRWGPTGLYIGGPTAASEKLEVLGNIKVNHIIGKTSAPTIAAGTGAGTSPTVSLSNATDLSGVINVTSGTTPNSSSIIATITFNSAYSVAPNVVIQPANAATALLSGATGCYVPIANTTTSVFVISSGPTPLTASTVYAWCYHVIQ